LAGDDRKHGLRPPAGKTDEVDAAKEVAMTVAESDTQLKASQTSAAFHNILVATDFSEPSRRALCDALVLATENHAQLSVVHVLHSDRKYAALEDPYELNLERIAADKEIKAMVDKLGPEQEINTTLLKHGPVAEQVAAVIEEKRIDLLVIGTRGRGGLQKLALGSVAEELLRIASCPVMTIGPKADIATITRGPGFHRILFATDFGKGSAKALPLALALARAQQAKLIMLHMINPIPATSASLSAYAPAGAAADEVDEWEDSSRKRGLDQLRQCLPAETGLEQEIDFVVGTDFLPEAVLTASAKFKVDLIVMGANRTASAKAAAHVPWSAVHEVVRYAPCPVLTVAG
jgi:nucleotide-binding universal stress UspA family protein